MPMRDADVDADAAANSGSRSVGGEATPASSRRAGRGAVPDDAGAVGEAEPTNRRSGRRRRRWVPDGDGESDGDDESTAWRGRARRRQYLALGVGVRVAGRLSRQYARAWCGVRARAGGGARARRGRAGLDRARPCGARPAREHAEGQEPPGQQARVPRLVRAPDA